MKVNEFIAKLKDVVDNHKTLYVMGCFGAPMTSANVTRYINHHSYNQASARQSMMKAVADQNPPVFGFDCVCLIKGILWGWNGNGSHGYGGAAYNSNGVPDYSADGTIKICKNVSTDFSKIKVGSALWCSGHIGVYIGDGKAIECTPAFKNNVQVTVVTNIRAAGTGENGRKWTSHGELPYIEYDDSATVTPVSTTAQTTTTNYTVKKTCSDGLNIRIGPGVGYDVVGTIEDTLSYTIVEEKDGWGRLKSGLGWISLAYTEKR